MALFDTIKNIGSNIKEFFGIGGGKASLEAFAPFGTTPTPTQQKAIQTIPQLSEPIRPGEPIQAIGESPEGIRFQQISPTTKKTIPGTERFVPTIRPLITTQPIPIPPPPAPLYVAPGTTAGYATPEERARREAQRLIDEQGKGGIAGTPSPIWNPGGGSAVPSGFNPAAGLSGLSGLTSGTPRAASLGGAVGGLGISNAGETPEEKKKGKQPQFTMITAQQAQDAARQGLLQGAGQSGVLKDAQGNFYGIQNAQVATQFGAPNAQGIQTVTPTGINPTLQPFQASINTQPISAEALLKGVPEKLLPTYEKAFQDLDTQIQENLANQPPLPATFAMDTPAQTEYRANQPIQGQQMYDQLYQQLGISNKAAEIANRRREITALEDGLQKIVKDIQDNPDFPKGLANRMITDFSNKNAITLRNLQAGLDTLLYEKGELDKDLNQRLGIYEKELTRQETQQEQARDNARQQVQQYISSGAFAEFSDEQLKQIADAGIGYDFSALKTMRDAQKSGSERKIADAQAKLDIQEERLRLAQEKAAKAETETPLSPTQINKGSVSAGLTTEVFKSLSPQAKNEYTFGDIEGKKKTIDKAIQDGEDPELIKQEIDNSNLSREVKNDLRTYIDKKLSTTPQQGFISKTLSPIIDFFTK